MKKLIFPILSMLMLGLASCKDGGDNIVSFWDIPAIVAYDHDINQPTLITSIGTLIAPGMIEPINEGKVFYGDAVLTSFEINYDEQPYPEQFVATLYFIAIIDKTWPQQTIGSDNYSSIENIEGFDRIIYNDENNIVLFFVFKQRAKEDQKFEYIMLYDSNDTSEIPTVYIFASKIGEGSGEEGTFDYIYAFDMSYFYRSTQKQKINVKFKTGEDGEGNNLYGAWRNNPIELMPDK